MRDKIWLIPTNRSTAAIETICELEMMNAKKEETAIVGDRITTDIKTGRDFGITSILLLTGETRQEDLDVAPVKPDLVFRDLTEFMASLWGEL